MGKPKFDKLIKKMEKEKSFELTRKQYIDYTGCDIPQKKSYTEKQSAVAKIAKEHGYTVSVIPERLLFEKE